MSVVNSTEATTMSSADTRVSIHVMWAPYVALGLAFILGLALSFKRHHHRLIKKKQYIVEYQEANLSIRKPRISGKTVQFHDIYSVVRQSPSADRKSSAISDQPLNSDDVHVSVTGNRDCMDYKKRCKSTSELDSPKLVRLVSEDEYFRRKGPRESYYLKSSSENQLSPCKQRRRVADTEQVRTLWIRSDLDKQKAGETRAEEAVKYIKVFDLDLCQNCRLYVEKVDGSVTHNPTQSSEEAYSRDLEMKTYSKSFGCTHSLHADEDLNFNPQIQSHISVAQVHSPPSSINTQSQPVQSREASPNGLHLSPVGEPRPRSASDLDSRESNLSNCFVLGMQGNGDVSMSSQL